MRKTSCFLAILFGICFSGNLTAQEVALSVHVNAALNEQTADGAIAVTIQNGSPAYTVFLFDKAPWKGGTQLKKLEQVTAGTVEFGDLLPGDYYIIVEDHDKNPRAKAVHVGIKPD